MTENSRITSPYLPVALLGAGAGLMVSLCGLDGQGGLYPTEAVTWFLGGAALMCMGFYWAIKSEVQHMGWGWFWTVALGLRLILLFQEPGGDIYRYVWEGKILLEGLNPYLLAPDSQELIPLRDALWENVQHKEHTAIYPPFAELLFAILSRVSESPVFFKGFFILADLAVVALLVRSFGVGKAIIYAWNPLVLVSFAGGGHYDSIFLLAMVAGWLSWRKQRTGIAMAWMGVAIALKWLALPLAGWIFWQSFVRSSRMKDAKSIFRSFCLGVLAILPLVVGFLVIGIWTGGWTDQVFSSKFANNARSAEFVPAIVGWIWDPSRYQNSWILVPMAAAWLVTILRVRDFTLAAEWLFFWALVLSPLVHIWYFTWLIPFAVLTRNPGTLALTSSGFVYFLLHFHSAQKGGAWQLHPLETLMLWLPFVLGFLWFRLRRGEPTIDPVFSQK